jgi:hypothetical protein
MVQKDMDLHDRTQARWLGWTSCPFHGQDRPYSMCMVITACVGDVLFCWQFSRLLAQALYLSFQHVCYITYS